jgi:hypothetical protein
MRSSTRTTPIEVRLTMTAKLDKPLKRELTISGQPYVVTISPEGIKLVLKGKRKGYELDWESLVSGDAALAAALNATLAKRPATPPKAPAPKRTKKARR